MAEGTITSKSIAAFVAIVLMVQYGHPLSANTSAVSVQEIYIQSTDIRKSTLLQVTHVITPGRNVARQCNQSQVEFRSLP